MNVDRHTTVHAVRRLLIRSSEGRPMVESLELTRAAEMLARISLSGTDIAHELGDRYTAGYRALLEQAGVADPAKGIGDGLERVEALRQHLAGVLPTLPTAAREPLTARAAELDRGLIDDLRTATRTVCDEHDGRIDAGEWPEITPARVTAMFRGADPALAGVRVVELTRIGGISANEAYFLTLADQGDWPDRVVLRRSRKVGIQPRPVSDEFHVLAGLAGTGVPAPAALLIDEGTTLDTSAVVVGRLPGAPQTLTAAGDVGREVTLQMADCLARVHGLDIPTVLPADRRAGDRTREEWVHARVAEFEAAWRGCTTEPSFIVEHAFGWLRRHAWLVADRSVVVHGDFDQRNALVEDGVLTGILDWEVAHEGHPAEDLAYIRPQAEALMPWADFLARYVAAGGAPVSGEQLRFAEVLANLLRFTTSMKAYATFAAGAHGDLLIASVVTLELESVLADVQRLTAREIARDSLAAV